MDSIRIPYKNTGYFSKTMLDYLEQKENIQPFYNRFPSIDNFEAQIAEKAENYPFSNRQVLVDALQQQYQDINTSESTQTNISALADEQTFTITTGHQLNLFSGPLYFLYKIISVINLCKQLKEKYPKQNFVPIYWMASEDHDFEEIQYFNHKAQKIKWLRESGGAVGRLSTDGLSSVFESFSNLLNSGKNAQYIKNLFENAYLKHDTLTAASRYLVNELFGAYGLVVIDGDDVELKKLFKPYALREVKEQVTFKKVNDTNQKLTEQGYKIQVNPREINLFHLGENYRERLVEEEGDLVVNHENIKIDVGTENPKNISPNALLRPLYQEVILPNLTYIGGGGELAYWLQLKTTFEEFGVTFPMLLLRNSALLINEKQLRKADKLNISVEDLFLKQQSLINQKVNQVSTLHVDFEEKLNQLQQNFEELRALANQTDASFVGAVNAQEKKQIKGLQNLEKRLLKAEKRKYKELVNRITLLQNELFPNQSLEERQRNFAEFYEAYGNDLILSLFKTLDPLRPDFTIVKL